MSIFDYLSNTYNSIKKAIDDYRNIGQASGKEGYHSEEFKDKYGNGQQVWVKNSPTPSQYPTSTPAQQYQPTSTQRPTIVQQYQPTPTQRPTNMPTPTPSPIQEFYRNPAIASGIQNNQGFKNNYENISNAIQQAAKEFNIPVNLLTDIAYKESSFDPNTSSKTTTASGLFQFTDPTWTDAKKYFGNNIDKKNPLDAARAAAWFISRKYLNKWDNSKVTIDPNTGIDSGWGRFYQEPEIKDYYAF
jgi:soluble lytic murein transglycosylase-like protein